MKSWYDITCADTRISQGDLAGKAVELRGDYSAESGKAHWTPVLVSVAKA